MKLLLYADGRRDKVTVPRFLSTLLDDHVAANFSAWKNIRVHGRGYGKKLAYGMRQAGSRPDLEGLVAVIDRDKDKKRIRWSSLAAERENQRANGINVRTALGEAVPHGEAWLLDDAEAVKSALALKPTHKIPASSRGSAKAILETLHSQSPHADRRVLEMWGSIAQQVRLERCRAPQKTGFKAFADDVKREFG